MLLARDGPIIVGWFAGWILCPPSLLEFVLDPIAAALIAVLGSRVDLFGLREI
jgi:hypothetical protein